MSTAITKEVPFDDACRFLIKLGEAAHAYGSTAARLEAYLTRMTAAFGLGGVFRSTPTDIVFAFQEEGAFFGIEAREALVELNLTGI